MSSVRSACSSAKTCRPTLVFRSAAEDSPSPLISGVITSVNSVTSVSGRMARLMTFCRVLSSRDALRIARRRSLLSGWPPSSMRATASVALALCTTSSGSWISPNRKPMESRRSSWSSCTAVLTLVASWTLSDVFCASRASLIRVMMIGMLSATTPSSGTSTSRASLPRMRNLPKSTGPLPPCLVDVAVGRGPVVLAAVATARELAGRDVAGGLADRAADRRRLAAPADRRPDQRGEHQQDRQQTHDHCLGTPIGQRVGPVLEQLGHLLERDGGQRA